MFAKKNTLKKTLRFIWITFGLSFLIWQFHSFSAQGFDETLAESSTEVAISDEEKDIVFLPQKNPHRYGVLFFPGGGVDPTAYLPLNRKIAENGVLAIIVKLPYRFAPFDAHKELAVKNALEIQSKYPEIEHWLVCGHSKGGEMAAMLAANYPEKIDGLVLMATSHPKRFSLADTKMPVKKIYGSNDGVAAPYKIQETAHYLPADVAWVEIKGGNHSQFGYYGEQLMDNSATISRDAQQAIILQEILKMIPTITNPD